MRIFALIVGTALGLAAASCSSPKEDPNINAAQEAVLHALTDPSSAQFRSVVVHSVRGAPVTVCGEVNAKNRMGGYNGFAQFAYVISTREVRIDPLSGEVTPQTDPVRYLQNSEFRIFHMDQCEAIDLPTVEESRARLANAQAELNRLEGR